MVKRTSPEDLPDWESAVDITEIVRDKRSQKRSGEAKRRRRNRRYANRLLNTRLTQVGIGESAEEAEEEL